VGAYSEQEIWKSVKGAPRAAPNVSRCCGATSRHQSGGLGFIESLEHVSGMVEDVVHVDGRS